MKKSTLSFKGVAVACLVAIATSASAANYVAVATGNYTSASTWGGAAPPVNVTSDNIVVPPGITVYLDQNVSVSTGSAAMTISGQLNALAGEDLYVTNGATLAGSGMITVDSLVLGGPSASLASNGTINARAFTSLGLSILSNANMTVNESVTVANGLLNLGTVTFNLANNGKLIMSGGQVNIGGTAVVNFSTYDVYYVNTSSSAGLELTPPTLRNIYINVPSNQTVSLTQHTSIEDTLFLNSGVLDLNGNNLTFNGNGTIGANGSGTISTTPMSNILINSNNSFAGALTFTSGSDNLNALVLNMGNSNATVKLGSDLNLTTQLSLTNGKLDVDGNGLAIGFGGTVAGGSANSYIITSNDGYLTLNIPAGSSDTFRVGTAANYSPIAVVANTGSAGGDVSASVDAGLLSGAMVGTDLAATQPVVNATWWVETNASTNVNMNVTPMWPAALEVNGFNRTEAFVSANTDGTWDVMPSSSAGTTGALYSMTRSNVTSDVAAYSVMDKDAVNNIVEVKNGKDFVVYPNPAINTLYFKTTASLREPVVVDIYDIAGHLVKTAVVGNANGVSVADLSAGYYTAQFTSGDYKAIEKFVKQ